MRTPSRKEVWGFAAIILFAAFTVTPGFFSIDEAIYYLGARAFEHGELVVNNNGFAQFHSDALKLRLLIDGPHGLAPQYPAGSAVLAGILLPFLEHWAFILPNVMAGILTLFIVREICLSQFQSETVARIALVLVVAGTFWVEFAVGIWPHTLAAFLAIQAYWFALRHLDPDGEETRYALLSGLSAGAGMLFRLDAVFAVPAIGLIMVLFASRFVRSAFLFAAGVLPAIALTSWFNYLKFGTLNPFSYGQVAGNTHLSTYGPLFAALCLGFGLFLLWRKFEWRVDGKAAIVALAILGGALLLVPATNVWLLRFWNGFLALIVDMRSVVDARSGVQPGPGHTVLFWGMVKKALGQSVPWIGLVAILAVAGIQRSERRIIASLLIFTAIILPFILLSWHGGDGSNMRYFLPVLPALCILCAKLFADLWRMVPNAIIFVATGIWGTLGLGVAWILLHPSGYAGVQQILSTYVLLATALAALAAGVDWGFRQVARGLAIALFAGGFVMSMAFAISDFKATKARRAQSYIVNETLARLPPRSLIITSPQWAVRHYPGNGSILARRDSESKRIDPQLIVNALDAGYRVFITSYEFDARRDVPPGVHTSATGLTYPGGRVIELRR